MNNFGRKDEENGRLNTAPCGIRITIEKTRPSLVEEIWHLDLECSS